MKPWCAFGEGVCGILRLTRERGSLVNRTRLIRVLWIRGRNTFWVAEGMLMDLSILCSEFTGV